MSEDKKFICEECGKSFKTAASLKGHKTRVHSESVEKEIKKVETAKAVESKTVKKRIVETKRYDDNDEILVRNGFRGTLHFLAPKSRYLYTFNDFGDELYIEFGDLKMAKSGDYIKFFQNNWLLIEDEDALKQLRLDKFYTNALSYEDMLSIFDLPLDEIEEVMNSINDDQKGVIASLAIDQIESNQLNDIRIINKLEELLGEELYYK